MDSIVQLLSVSDKQDVEYQTLCLSQSKIPWVCSTQVDFLVMLGKALPKTMGLCVDLSSLNRKVLCLHKEDVIIKFDIVAGLKFPTTTGWIMVLP